MSISLSMSARQAIADWFAADQGVVAGQEGREGVADLGEVKLDGVGGGDDRLRRGGFGFGGDGYGAKLASTSAACTH